MQLLQKLFGLFLGSLNSSVKNKKKHAESLKYIRLAHFILVTRLVSSKLREYFKVEILSLL